MHELDVVLGSEICVWGSAGRSPEAKACTNCRARYLKYQYYGCWTEQLHPAPTQTALASSCTKYSSQTHLLV